MPILQRELSRFPDHLFDDCYQRELDGEGALWWAVYTTSRKEKSFMRRLAALQIPFYCPMTQNRYRSAQGRLRCSWLPLFSNYVFLCTSPEQRVQAYTTNCISRCLEVSDPQRLLSDLKQIEQFIQADCPLTSEARLVPGTPVRIKSGPFAGVEGVVFQRQNASRLLISVDFLQAGASLEIDDWALEKIY